MGIRTDRAVEVLHQASTDAVPSWSVGSGYLIGRRLVLTAAHNVGPGDCIVRMVDGTEHQAVVRLRGDEIRLDLAVLELSGEDAPDLGESIRFAIVTQAQAELLERCTGLGFPRFKEDITRPRPRSGKALRNIEQLDGEIPTAAGSLANLLTFRVTARPREHPLPTGAAEFGGSPWQGISGTVVFARDELFGERAVGVVTEHHSAEGGNTLTLVPIGAIGAPGVLPADERQGWWDLLGVTDPVGLPELPGVSLRRRPTPPAPPAKSVARAELALATLGALCDGASPLVALVGGPGFGKSVLARIVAAKVDTPTSPYTGQGGERCCPGGAVWLDVGQGPDLSRLLAQKLTDLTGQSAGGRSLERLASDLADVLTIRSCLLVLDDVWPTQTSETDVVGLVLDRIRNVPRLVTTRSAALFDTLPGARRIDVEEMDQGEAYALLATSLPHQATEEEAAQLGQFAARLGRWPLLLGLAAAHLGRQVSDGVPVGDAIHTLAARYGERGVTAFDARHANLLDPGDPVQRQRAVAAAIEASLGLLVAEDAERYRLLAVFPDGQPIPTDVIAQLWEPTIDRFDTDDLLDELANLSLLSLDRKTRQARVHDLLRDYLQPSDPPKRAALHRRLLQGWGDARVLHDTYRIRWYAYHLDAAGESDVLYSLISPAWKTQVISVTGALSDVVADVARAAEHAARERRLPEELRCRLIITTLYAQARALPHTFRTVLANTATLDRALGDADLLPQPDRDAAFAAIASGLAAVDVDRALATTDRIDEPMYKARALASIAAVLVPIDSERAGMLTEQAVAESRRTATRRDFEDTLFGLTAALAALVSADPDRALAAVDHLPAHQALVQAEVLPALAGIDPDRALAAADHMTWKKPETLARIAAVLVSTDATGRSHQVADRALAIAGTLDYVGDREDAFAEIATTLAGTHPDRARIAIDHLTWKKAETLAGYAAVRARANPDEAVTIADRIDVPAYKARALAGVAAALVDMNPGRARQLVDEALDTAAQIDDPMQLQQRVTLEAMVAALAGPDPGLALVAANRIDDPCDKAGALASITTALAATNPSRAGQLADDALAAAGLCDHSGSRLAALDKIAPALVALAHTDPDRALAAADRVGDPSRKARTLADIASVIAVDPDRASELAERAAYAARVDSPAKARAVAFIAALVSDTEPDRARRLATQALAAADRIGDVGKKELALADIAAALVVVDPDLALATAESIDETRIRSDGLSSVSAVLARTDVDAALAVVSRIPDHDDRKRAFASVASQQAATDADKAVALAKQSPDSDQRAWALASVAAALASVDPSRAGQLVHDALTATSRIHNDGRREWVLAGVAAALARTEAGTALAVTHRIRARWDLTTFLAEIAAGVTTIDSSRAADLAKLATAYAMEADSRSDRYANDLDAIPPALNSLAPLTPERDDRLIDESLAAAERISDFRLKGQILAGIVSALGGTEPDRARRLADRAAARLNTEYDARVLGDVAAALADIDLGRARQLADQALAAADRGVDSVSKNMVLVDLTSALAKVDPGLALAAADHIEDPQYEAEALASLAEAWSRYDPTLDLHSGLDDATNSILTRSRALEPSIGTGVWWRLAQLFVSRTTAGQQRTNLVDAVLAVGEW